jgi:hypothetical protein
MYEIDARSQSSCEKLLLFSWLIFIMQTRYVLSEKQIDAEKISDDLNMYYPLRQKYRKLGILHFARREH